MLDTNKLEGAPATTEAKGVVETAKEKAKGIAAGAADAAGAAKEKAAEIAATAKEKVKDLAAGAGEMAAQAKDKVQEWGAVAADKAGEAAQDIGREITNLVRRYPIQAMVAGLAVGFLLARVTSRR